MYKGGWGMVVLVMKVSKKVRQSAKSLLSSERPK